MRGPALYARLVADIESAYAVCLKWARASAPWDLAVHLGDITGGYLGRGVDHPSITPIAARCAADLAPLSPTVRVCLGNHDVGYRELDGTGGISVESVERCKELFGELFWSVRTGEGLLLGICSAFADYWGDEERIRALRREQEQFVGDTLAAERPDRWSLFTHTPFVVRGIAAPIRAHLRTLDAVVYGEFHAPRFGRLLRRIASLVPASGRSVLAVSLRRGVPCPSTAPLWWKGYGLLARTGSCSWNEIDLSQDAPAPSPASSPLRMLRWCVPTRRKS